ncbi:MAG: hypothetical protein E6K54_02985 [Gammaproteobacteria bacterium]|nr:MAG: hypothetical protein E6K54_02985 [Gammaproteobacteria bacterium]
MRTLEVPNLMAAVSIDKQRDIANYINNKINFDSSCNFQMLFRGTSKCQSDYLPINIFILDENGYLIWGNSRMIKTLNETEDSLIGRHVSYWGEDKWNACEKILCEGNEEVLEEVGIDQRIYLTNKTSIKEKIDKKIIRGVLGISLDITEQKKFILSKNFL